MNKFYIGILSLVLIACSKDGSGPEPNPNLELAIGTWRLTELNIAPEQDIDEDGQSTTNIMDELNCISGTLQLNADYSWTFSGTDVVITTITGGLFKFFCSESPRTAQGIWDINGNGIRLADDVGNLTNFVLDTEEILLINTIGNSLPGLQAEVYSKN